MSTSHLIHQNETTTLHLPSSKYNAELRGVCAKGEFTQLLHDAAQRQSKSAFRRLFRR